MKLFYADHFVLPLPPGHRFPMSKYRLLRDRVAEQLPGAVLKEALPASDEALARADALEAFEREHHHAPDAHEKARLLSETVKEWEHEEVAATHPDHKPV